MRAKKVDRNQKEIVEMLRKIPGVSVAYTHTIGNGFPDIVVGFKGVNYLCEIKDGTLKPSAQKLTPDEDKFHKEWTGQITVANNIDKILELINRR